MSDQAAYIVHHIVRPAVMLYRYQKQGRDVAQANLLMIHHAILSSRHSTAVTSKTSLIASK